MSRPPLCLESHSEHFHYFTTYVDGAGPQAQPQGQAGYGAGSSHAGSGAGSQGSGFSQGPPQAGLPSGAAHQPAHAAFPQHVRLPTALPCSLLLRAGRQSRLGAALGAAFRALGALQQG